MPKIRPDAIKSVFYLYRRNPKTGEIDGPWGTGFFVYRSVDPGRGATFYYAVTNKHVAVSWGASIIRINQKGGGTRFLEFEPDDWQGLKNGDDVCAVEIDIDTHHSGDYSVIPEFTFILRKEIESRGVNVGENAFMVGLFASHSGGDRNAPSARFGNVAMMANDSVPIKTEGGFNRPCHIVDMRSRSGFSGSPVFIYRTPTDDLTFIPGNETYVDYLKRGSIFLRLFGIHCAQFAERIDVRKALKPEESGSEIGYWPGPGPEATEAAIHDGDELTLPSSMTIVVPCWRITELLDQEVFDMVRRVKLAEKDRQQRSEPPLPVLESGHPSSDENPKHREDFTSLLNSAAKKQPQGD